MRHFGNKQRSRALIAALAVALGTALPTDSREQTWGRLTGLPGGYLGGVFIDGDYVVIAADNGDSWELDGGLTVPKSMVKFVPTVVYKGTYKGTVTRAVTLYSGSQNPGTHGLLFNRPANPPRTIEPGDQFEISSRIEDVYNVSHAWRTKGGNLGFWGGYLPVESVKVLNGPLVEAQSALRMDAKEPAAQASPNTDKDASSVENPPAIALSFKVKAAQASAEIDKVVLHWAFAIILAPLAAILLDYILVRRTKSQAIGRWPNPKKWFYQERSGEFYRIVDKVQGEPVFHPNETYKNRWGTWYVNRRSAMRFRLAFPIWTLVALFCFLRVNHLVGYLLALTGALSGLLWLATEADAFIAYLKIGPQPRRPATDDHGPSTAETPADHPADDDLVY